MLALRSLRRRLKRLLSSPSTPSIFNSRESKDSKAPPSTLCSLKTGIGSLIFQTAFKKLLLLLLV
ncbi:hypothetical protein GQX74_004501 [Glossina fuscipes]|nr:hypothetical protein GQX74_004501 [Glossina fuscipes]